MDSNGMYLGAFASDTNRVLHPGSLPSCGRTAGRNGARASSWPRLTRPHPSESSKVILPTYRGIWSAILHKNCFVDLIIPAYLAAWTLRGCFQKQGSDSDVQDSISGPHVALLLDWTSFLT